MKLIFNIDKDEMLAILLLMKPSAENKKQFSEWMEGHDQIEVPEDLFDKEGSRELMMTMSAVALAAVANELEKQK